MSKNFTFVLVDSPAGLRARLSSDPWWKVADQLASDIAITTQFCAIRALPLAEIKALWLTHLSVFNIILQAEEEWRPTQIARLRVMWREKDQKLRAGGVNSLRDRQNIFERNDWFHRKELRRLQTAMRAFLNAFYGRMCDSPQARFAEVRLSCRRALMEKHNPTLDRFPKLVETLRKVCCAEVHSYMEQYVDLKPDQFLDMLHVVAYDQADAATVAYPPARIRSALTRQHRRQESQYQRRWIQMSPEQIVSFNGRKQLESEVIAKVDWEHARHDLALPEDQARAVEARIQGVDLQSAEAAEYLGLDPSRTEAIRRSLQPDRRLGKKLRRRFSAYRKNGGC